MLDTSCRQTKGQRSSLRSNWAQWTTSFSRLCPSKLPLSTGGHQPSFTYHSNACTKRCHASWTTTPICQIYRGLRRSSRPSLSCSPEVRSYLRGPDAMFSEAREEALEFQPSVYYTEGARKEDLKAPAPISAQKTAPVVGGILRFSGCGLNELQALATDPSGNGWVSTFEALSAYLYQTAYCGRLRLLISHGMTPSAAASQLSRGFWDSIDAHARLNLPSATSRTPSTARTPPPRTSCWRRPAVAGGKVAA